MSGMNDIDALAARIHNISTEKGFSAPSMGNLPGKLMLSVSELSEALEEHRSKKPLVYFKCQECGAERLSPEPRDNGHYIPRKGIIDYMMRRLGFGTSMKLVLCNGRIDKPEGILTEIGDSIIRNLHMMQALLEEAEDDRSAIQVRTISEVLDIKVDYNATRPHMHGRNY